MGGKPSAFAIAKQNYREGEPLKTVVLTGCSSGIGLSTLIALASNGYKVLGIVRTPSKMEKIMQEDQKSFPDSVKQNISIFQADFANLQSVSQCAKQILASLKDDSVLDGGIICNAGYFPSKYSITVDGFEECFQTCHLAHHLLIRILETKLVPKSRIVFVSSAIHHMFSKEYDWPTTDPQRKGFESDSNKSFTKLGADLYAQAKLCNVHSSLALGTKWRHLECYAVHPGGVDTGIWPWFVVGTQFFLLSPEQGAAPMVHVFTKPSSDVYAAGTYWVPASPLPKTEAVSRWGANLDVANRLLEESDRIVAPFLL